MYRGEFKRELKSRLVEYYGLYPDEQTSLEVVNTVEWISQRVQDLLRDHSFTMSDRDNAVCVRFTMYGRDGTDCLCPGICRQFWAPRRITKFLSWFLFGKEGSIGRLFPDNFG